MLTLQQLQEQAYATAREKGWHDRPLRELGLVAGGPNGDEREGFVIHYDRILAKHALMHTELTEAHDCMERGAYAMYIEDGKPEGMIVEIADFIIRACDTAQALDIELVLVEDWLAGAGHSPTAREIAEHAGSHYERYCLGVLGLGHVRRLVDRAAECVRVDKWEAYAEKMALAVRYATALAIGFSEVALRQLSPPPEQAILAGPSTFGAAIEAKMAYNKTRPHRHGGKRA